jgi:cytochrome c oxidase subunit 4
MSAPVISVKTYGLVLGSLRLLTTLTTFAAFVDLGQLNAFVALTIAVIKATLVALFFMHLRVSERLTWVFASVAVLWLMILISFVVADILSRNWIPIPKGWL